MSIQDRVNNDLVQDKSTVWLLKQHENFGYSDGVESEKYLERVFNEATDLSYRSKELETYIKDWPSEYHLTVNRAQLFSGFDFDPSLKVLEVGCGCGAITRYLGENFNDVVSIEGSINRARLARLRTKDLDSVSIICAPFQEIKFSSKFDIIFCVGVYEYSASFVPGDEPYDQVLSYFSDMLTPNGIVVIAIENQFGLKYFTSAREDHTGVMFEGLEGYHAHGNKVKTFGKKELEANLKNYFSTIKFYYPYPDYKLPDCVISDEFLSSGQAGELVSQIQSRDYYGERKSLWDESLVSLELSRNEMLPFFSNSFLVFAGKTELKGVSFDQLAINMSTQRVPEFRTQSRIYTTPESTIAVTKKALSGEVVVKIGKLSLVESSSDWKEFNSLHTELYGNCLSKDKSLKEIFSPCLKWLNFLNMMSETRENNQYLPGEYIDYIWSNIYFDSNGISIIDKEWIWQDDLKFNAVVIRSIYIFLLKVEKVNELSHHLQHRSLKKLIVNIADSIGINLNNEDFLDFIELESDFQSLVSGLEKKYLMRKFQWLLLDRSSFYLYKKIRVFNGKVISRIKRLIDKVYSKFV